jgi:hypothetical protein
MSPIEFATSANLGPPRGPSPQGEGGISAPTQRISSSRGRPRRPVATRNDIKDGASPCFEEGVGAGCHLRFDTRSVYGASTGTDPVMLHVLPCVASQRWRAAWTAVSGSSPQPTSQTSRVPDLQQAMAIWDAWSELQLDPLADELSTEGVAGNPFFMSANTQSVAFAAWLRQPSNAA